MNNLENEFIEYAIKHDEATEKGDHLAANKMHSKLSLLWNTIKANGDYDILRNLVNHSNESVRLWSASFLLRIDESKALEVLTDLKRSERIIGLTAKTIIDMWHKGMLDFYE